MERNMGKINLVDFVQYKVIDFDIKNNMPTITLQLINGFKQYPINVLSVLTDALKNVLFKRNLTGKKSNTLTANLKYLLPFARLQEYEHKQTNKTMNELLLIFKTCNF